MLAARERVAGLRIDHLAEDRRRIPLMPQAGLVRELDRRVRGDVVPRLEEVDRRLRVVDSVEERIAHRLPTAAPALRVAGDRDRGLLPEVVLVGEERHNAAQRVPDDRDPVRVDAVVVRRLQEVDGVDHVERLVLHRHGEQGAVRDRHHALDEVIPLAKVGAGRGAVPAADRREERVSFGDEICRERARLARRVRAGRLAVPAAHRAVVEDDDRVAALLRRLGHPQVAAEDDVALLLRVGASGGAVRALAGRALVQAALREDREAAGDVELHLVCDLGKELRLARARAGGDHRVGAVAGAILGGGGRDWGAGRVRGKERHGGGEQDERTVSERFHGLVLRSVRHRLPCLPEAVRNVAVPRRGPNP